MTDCFHCHVNVSEKCEDAGQDDTVSSTFDVPFVTKYGTYLTFYRNTPVAPGTTLPEHARCHTIQTIVRGTAHGVD
jgi:hypothetical protein